jgi:hypothetical protein
MHQTYCMAKAAAAHCSGCPTLQNISSVTTAELRGAGPMALMLWLNG